ncbi:hypothetical protein V8F20_011768 [Naviculisporaceae sp. PSN 640]
MAPHEEGPAGAHSDPHGGGAKFPLHGTLMWTSYLLLFPLGTLLIRTSPPSPRPPRQTSKGPGHSSSPLSKLPSLSLSSITPFTRHWIPQAIATVLSLTGAVIGWSHTHFSRPKSLHTILGSLISFCLVIQVLLGWRHHVAFLRIRQRTWMARVHIWLGRAILAMGWTNIMLGMSHHHHEILGVSAIIWAGLVIFLWAVGLGTWIWLWGRGERLRREREGEAEEEAVGLTATGVVSGNRAVGDEYFELGGISDDEDLDDDDDGKKPMRRSGE